MNLALTLIKSFRVHTSPPISWALLSVSILSYHLSIMRFQVLTAASVKLRSFWDVVPCSAVEVDRRFIALMMAAVRTSETSVNFDLSTRRYTPKDSILSSKYLLLKSYQSWRFCGWILIIYGFYNECCILRLFQPFLSPCWYLVNACNYDHLFCPYMLTIFQYFAYSRHLVENLATKRC
jgi:hypothetical protein